MFESSEAIEILADLRELRRRVIDAWSLQGVILTPEERRELRAEIKETCSLLTDLTSSGT
jgi:hypothetical protein